MGYLPLKNYVVKLYHLSTIWAVFKFIFDFENADQVKICAKNSFYEKIILYLHNRNTQHLYSSARSSANGLCTRFIKLRQSDQKVFIKNILSCLK